MNSDKGKLTNKLMVLREDWTLEDFKEAYADEWEEMPTNLADCFAQMEEWIFHTYDLKYLKEVIEDESNQ